MQHYDTYKPGLASELFDGELVVADYVSGLYYSISKTGAVIWQALRAGYATEEITDRLASVATDLDAKRFVPEFVARLAAEGLIAARAPSPDRGNWPEFVAADLSEPGLERFEDLRDLLLLDPVHDVDQQGWPHRAE